MGPRTQLCTLLGLCSLSCRASTYYYDPIPLDPLLPSDHAFASIYYFPKKLWTIFTLKASPYFYNPMVHKPWVGRHKFTLNYIILGQTTLWLILDSRTLCPHFAESLHYIDQNLGFKPQKHAMGGSTTQQVILFGHKIMEEQLLENLNAITIFGHNIISISL